MNPVRALRRLTTTSLLVLCMATGTLGHTQVLDLGGYTDTSGAVAIQHRGNTVDPYFTLQALLLAKENGLDTRGLDVPWARWLLARQKPDATFDRFCRNGPVWQPCKTADADDALLALWLRFIDTLPAAVRQEPAFVQSAAAASATLLRLVSPPTGIYLVSPVYMHGLFMDNLEVWTYLPAHAATQNKARPSFGASIQSVFWDPERLRYHVSTQPEQKTAASKFYPDAVAQIFPHTVNFPFIPGGAKAHYRRWITEHRAEWLRQVETDFAWGLIATVSLHQGDLVSVRCWQQKALPARHGPHWTVTDEVVQQILQARSIAPQPPEKNCQ
ncbi:hypothetical protein [Hydrogenophaga sp. RWCD_12]|uniref:hypothetical protein n=1 Tax=Hydrogenophaga sp. RWCD_12 TaxID=3391190 RepID=UPI003985301C